MNSIEKRMNALERAVGVGTVPEHKRRQVIVQIYTDHPDERPMEAFIEERKAELLARYRTIEGVTFDTVSINIAGNGEGK